MRQMLASSIVALALLVIFVAGLALWGYRRVDVLMKYVALLVLCAAIVVVVLSTKPAFADPPSIGMTPDAGPVGTTIQIFHSVWPEEQEVRLYAAYSQDRSDGYNRTADFVGPVATAFSDAEGHWDVNIATDEIPGLELPDAPGYLFIRAESDELPAWGNSVRHFVLTSGDRRPEGAGQITASLAMADGALANGLWGWRSVGSPYFTTPYGLVPIPFDPTIPSGNGEFEIVAVTDGGHEPVGPGTVELSADAVLCLNPACDPSAPIVPVHSALRVTVANNEIVEANVVLGELTSDVPGQRGASASTATTPEGSAGRSGLVIGGSALLALLILGASFLGFRRMAR